MFLKLANSSAYKTMKTFKVILENAEITLPGLTDTNIIVKGNFIR